MTIAMMSDCQHQADHPHSRSLSDEAHSRRENYGQTEHTPFNGTSAQTQKCKLRLFYSVSVCLKLLAIPHLTLSMRPGSLPRLWRN